MVSQASFLEDLTLARADSDIQSGYNRAYGYRKDLDERQLVDRDSLLLEVFRQYQPPGENSLSEARQGYTGSSKRRKKRRQCLE